MPRFNPLKPTHSLQVTAPIASVPVPDRSAPVPVHPTSLVPTLTENKAKNGIELRFPQKPEAEMLELLKSAGWRWSRFSACWYQRDTPEQRAFAEQLLSGRNEIASCSREPLGRAPEVADAPQSGQPQPEPASVTSSNIVPVAFSPSAFTPAITQRPVPAWKRAVMPRINIP